MNNKGFITLHRKLSEWEWYSDTNTFKLFIHLLIYVNWEDKKWRGNIVKRGSIITSINNLSEAANLSPQKVRTSLDRLISTGEILKNTTNKYTLLTVVKYDLYQRKDENVTNKQQTNNKQITTTKQYKQLNKKNNILYRETEFKNSLQQYLAEYGKETLNNFFLYWTEKKPKGRKMRFEMEKTFDAKRRLTRWNNNNFNKNNNEKRETINSIANAIREKQTGNNGGVGLSIGQNSDSKHTG